LVGQDGDGGGDVVDDGCGQGHEGYLGWDNGGVCGFEDGPVAINITASISCQRGLTRWQASQQ
jgi:hypothetical protein